MPSSKVVLALDRENAEHLLDGCEHPTNAAAINGYSCERCREMGADLRAALQQDQQVEEAVQCQYRVVVDFPDSAPIEYSPGTLEEAKNTVQEEARAGGEHPVRIQKQAIYRGPWTDLEDQEGSE